ncbi:MAG: aspartate carbamoyltransferase catalytic subunit [Candidatus Limnocylindrales bacterium]
MSWSGRHLLDVEGWSESDVDRVVTVAEDFRVLSRGGAVTYLSNTHVALLFAEPSTRTRLSFEIAARRLGAKTYVLDPGSSSMVKGETLVDTVRNLDAIGFSALVVRHHRAGAAAVAARYFGGTVINAGDGWHAHPTQALVDAFTLRDVFGQTGLRGRKVAIVGDVLHSRVARSNVWTLTGAGAEVWLCGPAAWVQGLESLPVRVTTDCGAALRDAAVVMGLRVQKERMAPGVSLSEYVRDYQVTESRLMRTAPESVYMHPGPINEGVEVTREVARGPRSLVLEQARNGVPMRMAVLSLLAVGVGATPEMLEPALARS